VTDINIPKTDEFEQRGFTIVELLVVIVVIGILAAVTVISYTGVSQKAVIASLQSDLSSASTQLNMYQVENSAYPNSVTDCPTPSAGNICLKATAGNTFSSYSANNSTTPQTYTLTATNDSRIYKVTNNSKPIALESAPLSPVADWLATTEGDHYGNFYDLVNKQSATVTRSTPKTIYDPATQKIYNVPVNKLAINPRSDGKSGSEAVIEEGRTNYQLGSNLDTGTVYDTRAFNGTGGTRNGTANYEIIDGGVLGTKNQHMNYTGVSGDAGASVALHGAITDVGSFSAGDIVTISGWAKVSISGHANARLELNARDSAGAIISTYSIDTGSVSGWTRFSRTSPALPINTSRVNMKLWLYNFYPGESVDAYFSCLQIEKGTFATSYIPTTTSIVARGSDNVNIPTNNWSSSSGTVVAVAGRTPNNVTSPYLFSWMASNTERLLLFDAGGTGNMAFGSKSAGGDSTTGVRAMASSAVITGSWSAGAKLNAYVDGSVSNSTTNYFTPTGLPSNATIGSNSGGYSYWYGPISRLIVYPSALTALDVTDVTNSVKDGP